MRRSVPGSIGVTIIWVAVIVASGEAKPEILTAPDSVAGF
jgi:hypothetical protein